MSSLPNGVKAFSIEGRLYRERERLTNFTEKERAWRKQWLKDQHLAHDEPKFVPELYKELYNPIRRAYWIPLNSLYKVLKPVMGEEKALLTRTITGKLLMAIAGVYLSAYYFKYNANDWTRKGGWRVITSRPRCVPGESEYPALPDRKDCDDYAARGFKESPI